MWIFLNLWPFCKFLVIFKIHGYFKICEHFFNSWKFIIYLTFKYIMNIFYIFKFIILYDSYYLSKIQMYLDIF
jgi:hypothetical protein